MVNRETEQLIEAMKAWAANRANKARESGEAIENWLGAENYAVVTIKPEALAAAVERGYLSAEEAEWARKAKTGSAIVLQGGKEGMDPAARRAVVRTLIAMEPEMKATVQISPNAWVSYAFYHRSRVRESEE